MASCLRPHLEYATPVWSPLYKKDKIIIEKDAQQNLFGHTQIFHTKKDYTNWDFQHQGTEGKGQKCFRLIQFCMGLIKLLRTNYSHQLNIVQQEVTHIYCRRNDPH